MDILSWPALRVSSKDKTKMENLTRANCDSESQPQCYVQSIKCLYDMTHTTTTLAGLWLLCSFATSAKLLGSPCFYERLLLEQQTQLTHPVTKDDDHHQYWMTKSLNDVVYSFQDLGTGSAFAAWKFSALALYCH